MGDSAASDELAKGFLIFMETKICTKCKSELDYSFFTKDKQKKDGYRPSCRNCERVLVSREPIIIDDLPGEIWKDVSGYEGFYQISNKSRVKSIGREIVHISKLHNTPRWEKTKLLKQYETGKKGKRYLTVKLYYGNMKNGFQVHILVAKHFVENPYNLSDVNHKDFDKLNNNDWNLEWVTKRENCTHRSNQYFKTSIYTGVSWSKSSKKWIAQITIKGKYECLGLFLAEEDASLAYTKRLNEIDDINKYALVP